MPDLITIGSTVVEIHTDGLTLTRLPGGGEVHARAHRTSEYLARAGSLGYGIDVDALSRDHEITHSLLATWLGLQESPTFRGVADGRHWQHWQAEESAVLGIQRLAVVTGVNLVALARRTGQSS